MVRERAEMAGLTFQFHSVVAIVIALAAVAAAAATLPNCESKCGDVDIPYPFGIGAGCFRDGFDLVCNRSLQPPRPFIGDTSIELIDVSLTLGRARAYTHIDWACYNATDYVDGEIIPFNLSTRPAFTISAAENKFTAVGCANLAVVGNDHYASACISECSGLAGTRNGICDGFGCCQTEIPDGTMTVVQTLFGSGLNFSSVREFNPCSYAFIVEHDWYNFSSADLTNNHLNQTYKFGMPVVLDWSVGNMTICEEARRNLMSPPASYACADKNSECFSSSTGEGYICNCTKGYKGNPYISGGCQDVDECNLPSEYNNCYGICTNTIGNYTCSCPQGKMGDPTTENGCHPTTSSTLPQSLKVLIATMSSILFLTISGFSINLWLKKRKLMKSRQKFFEQNGGVLLQQQMNSYRGVTFKLFTQEELKKATDNFSSSRIIGRGGQGTVYEGTLEDNILVAIKKSKLADERQTREFAKELLILSQINHKNVIKLLGCCLEVEVPMLVYELVSKGNLFEYLHSKIHRFHIPLDARLRIAMESAEALAYLHSSASTPIIHGDVKSSNILLDDEYTAKVSDFGASKLAPKDATQLATFVQGTCGYLDPEYMLTCQLTKKSDVFSFGVVILELLTRRKAFEFNVSGEEMLLTANFISAMKENKVEEMVDPEIKNEEDMVVIKEVCKLVVLCLNSYGDERPTMKEVAEDLGKLRKNKQILDMQSKHQKPVDDIVVTSDYVHEPPQKMQNVTSSEHSTSSNRSLEVQAQLSIGSGR
ncbi:wall-associated receptor kinase 5-like [Curcuma longa]|uniref:wall-associated receptor kinase 5-like n=1 Tax=Curcuma longa TaxID=136217 RepID=UPI003D9F7E77